MIIIILILSIILLLLSYFLYIQKNKVMLLQQQIGDLKNKMSILEKQELAAEQHNNFLRQEANTVHLYASSCSASAVPVASDADVHGWSVPLFPH